MRRGLWLLLVLAVMTWIGYALWSAGPRIPESAVLVLDLRGGLEEVPPRDAIDALLADGPALATVVLQLDKAAADARIAGAVLHIHSLALSYARIQELRDAMARFRASGKRAIALLDLVSFNATRELYLASAADEVYAVPGYRGPLAGLAGQYLSLGGFLAKLGIQVEFERVGEWKSAPETFALERMTEPARQQAREVVDGVFDQVVAGLAEARGLERRKVARLFDRAPAEPDALRDAGLIDGEADLAKAIELAGSSGAEPVDFEAYVQVDPTGLGLRSGPSIALVFADGNVIEGRGSRTQRFASDDLVEALETARDDDDIVGVVVRVNSPGGSSLAAEHVWRAIRSVREHKPVVVSMGDYAASGGYYVASAASAIVAQPATVTGSIGVFVMRPALAGLFEKLGIGSEIIARGEFASFAASDQPLTPFERERTRALVDSIYRDFLERVAEGRKLSQDRVDELGRGRVWLGARASELGLLDVQGGLHEAVSELKRLAGIPEHQDPARVVFPPPRGLGEALRELLRTEWRPALLQALLPDHLASPALRAMLRGASEGGISLLPSYWIEIH
jgi:protease-4